MTRLHGVSPSLLFNWRRLMSEGGQVAVRADEAVVAASRARELERLLGRKTLEVEVLREALEAPFAAIPPAAPAKPWATPPGKKPAWRLPSPLPGASR